jgi:hypothetical protein
VQRNFSSHEEGQRKPIARFKSSMCKVIFSSHEEDSASQPTRLAHVSNLQCAKLVIFFESARVKPEKKGVNAQSAKTLGIRVIIS